MHTPPAESDQNLSLDPAGSGRGIRGRAWGIGACFVVGLSAITPWNDYVLNNTPLIGSAFPTALALFILTLVLLNAPLRKYKPLWALSSRELALILAMGLVGCAVPAGGFMRYLVGQLAGLNHIAGEDERYGELFRSVDLPPWLFPTFTTDIAQRPADPVIRGLMGRIPLESPGLMEYLAAVPFSAWVVPALTWGLFFALVVAGVLSMSALVRRQWVENERLPFPLATIYLSLIESPEKGRLLNATLSSPLFWIAAGTVFLLHGFSGLHTYFPRYVPELPLGYDLRSILRTGPWAYVEDDFKKAQIVFSVVGITYFLSQKVAFSLVFFYVLYQVTRVGYGQYELDFSSDMQRDQLFGALFPYVAAMLYVARHHLLQVSRAMFGRRRRDDPVSRYLPDGLAGWVLLGSSAGMIVFLWAAGLSLSGAVVLVLMMMMFYLVVARIVAETGMPYVGLYLPLTLPFTYLLTVLPSGLATKFAARDFFGGQLLYGLFAHDHRESLPPYALHAMRVADETIARDDGRPGDTRPARRLIPAMVLSLSLAFIVSLTAWLVTDYRFASTIDRGGGSDAVNVWGAYLQPRYFTYEPTLAYESLTPDSPSPHSRGTHLAFGAGLMTFLSVFRLRYEAFPLHPIGFLMAYTLGLKWVWFSVFLGYIAKGLTIKLGGAGLYRRMMPLFVGLILGEAAAATFWLLFNVGRLYFGYDFTQIKLLPG
ncbi:DUF6785 family protein [Cyanobium sp. Cruz-8H5]|uniref:DUF6785 family protein n=1 Tax=Cyanobium sp. Cruz-8H5 TaxID=2823712 RepID=UPI0020CC6BDD|nr:DUF6785 family protein [Cyanobium sp. Cruz-8H5]MCP9861415.1 hypothetical protein [Cyanobium sp. Cruz-8H5]